MSNYFMVKHLIESRIRKLRSNERGQSFTELVILVCAGLVVAAFVTVPQLRTFAGTVMTGLSTWWTGTVSAKIFPTT